MRMKDFIFKIFMVMPVLCVMTVRNVKDFLGNGNDSEELELALKNSKHWENFI